MTNNTDPCTNPNTIVLTDAQVHALACDSLRKKYQAKNQELGVELWGEIASVGRNLFSKFKQLMSAYH